MKLDIDFKELRELVSNMGASLIEWKSDVVIKEIESDWKIQLETKGIDVTIDDISIASSGLIKYNGEQILLHIKEVANFGYGYKLPKFHFYDCNTLKKMRSSGRFDRYVVTQRKDGTFLIDKRINGNDYDRDVIQKLDCCRNCLNWYNKNYDKNYDTEDFSIAKFFKQFNNTPIVKKPTHTDINAPISGYTPDWKDISSSCKEKCKWVCQECGEDYSQKKTGLETHHINGLKSDNSPNNLKVLCKFCHSQQPYHQHMKT